MLPGIGLCQETFICLESDRKNWKFQREVGFVLVKMSPASLCSPRQLMSASQAHSKVVSNGFSSLRNLELIPSQQAVQCNPDPKQQEPSAGSPMPFACILNQRPSFLYGLAKRITEELLDFQVQGTLTHFRSWIQHGNRFFQYWFSLEGIHWCLFSLLWLCCSILAHFTYGSWLRKMQPFMSPVKSVPEHKLQAYPFVLHYQKVL